MQRSKRMSGPKSSKSVSHILQTCDRGIGVFKQSTDKHCGSDSVLEDVSECKSHNCNKWSGNRTVKFLTTLLSSSLSRSKTNVMLQIRQQIFLFSKSKYAVCQMIYEGFHAYLSNRVGAATSGKYDTKRTSAKEEERR